MNRKWWAWARLDFKRKVRPADVFMYLLIPTLSSVVAFVVWLITGWSLVGWLFTPVEALIIIAVVMVTVIVIDKVGK